MTTETAQSALPYRFNVGIALFNAQRRVFLGKSIPDGPEYVLPDHEWQMPQGGIDPDEDIVAAARRELLEETGIRDVALLAVTSEWWRYDFPPARGARTGHKLERFRGQQQRWVAFSYSGSDSAIDLSACGDDFAPEFSDWRWATLEEAVLGVMPYKRAVYAQVAEAFARFATL
jgi:putative (di)nucleoside polyphosphate hydrolase